MSLNFGPSKKSSDLFMTTNHAQSCVILAFTPDHALAAAALSELCKRSGLKVYTVGDQVNDIEMVFDQVKRDGLQPVLVLHACGDIKKRSAMSCSVSDIESSWRSLCYSGSLLGQRAMATMR